MSFGEPPALLSPLYKMTKPEQPSFLSCTVCGEKKNSNKFLPCWSKPDQAARVCNFCAYNSIGWDYKRINGSLIAGGGDLTHLPWETWKPHKSVLEKNKKQEKFRDTRKDCPVVNQNDNIDVSSKNS